MGAVISLKGLIGVPKVAAVEPEEDDEFDDPVERMLKKTGCLEKHYSVQVSYLCT